MSAAKHVGIFSDATLGRTAVLLVVVTVRTFTKRAFSKLYLRKSLCSTKCRRGVEDRTRHGPVAF